jgi:hypothetical protein
MTTIALATALTAAIFAAIWWDVRQVQLRDARRARAKVLVQMRQLGVATELAARKFGELQEPLREAGVAFRRLAEALAAR